MENKYEKPELKAAKMLPITMCKHAICNGKSHIVTTPELKHELSAIILKDEKVA
ncbi:MAG: hypothetical protein LBM69_03595 [Lachnospiraceae bacterium]|jgi:hypothetical protein|nr:hypothetical protein [Lachnospiraceae bacterium]